MDKDGSVLWAVAAEAEAAGEGKGADAEANVRSNGLHAE
jgi:hypothetical protein